ncbi:MAG: xanthine dehydrogenase family protein molybdopterin-binding subunit [Alphaproteobacteria bacterium]
MSFSSSLGQAAPRAEDHRMLTGHGRFVDDLMPDDALHAVFFRSPVAHATITGLDIEDALAVDGVRAILTWKDLDKAGVEPVSCMAPMHSHDGKRFREPVRHLLAKDTVRFVGDPVALVIAVTEHAARDAVELIGFDYENLDVCVDTGTSADIAFELREGDAERTEEAFSAADHVVSIEVVNNRVVGSPIEPRSLFATYDAAEDRYTLVSQSQGVHFLRNLICKPLGLSKEQVRVVTPDVGGSFAVKLTSYPDQPLMLFAARHVGATVRWTETRGEAMLADVHGRDHVTRGELAFDNNGRILGMKVVTRGNLGAYASPIGPFTSGRGFIKMLGHSYSIPALQVRSIGVYTNTAPTDAYRGAGKPESTYILERLMEKASQELGIERFDLRRRNLIRPEQMPYTSPVGIVYHSGDIPRVFEKALLAADVAGFANRRVESKKAGKLRGLGLCPAMHLGGGNTNETSDIRVGGDGVVTLRTGVQASGQGHETVFMQLVSDRLQIPMENVRVIEGDTNELADGGGTGGSSSLTIAGPTIERAARSLIENARQRAADRLETAPADIDYGDGRFTVVGTDRSIGLFELAQALENDGQPGCAATETFDGDPQAVTVCTYACEVEIDPDTGGMKIVSFTCVDDLGNVLNPGLAYGQIMGGLTQAIGQAVMEHTVYDPSDGQMLSGSLMDYCLPRAADVPAFALNDAGIPAPNNTLGAKGAGEVGANGGCGPVICAILDALRAAGGATDIDMPATPEVVWRALRGEAPARSAVDWSQGSNLIAGNGSAPSEADTAKAEEGVPH